MNRALAAIALLAVYSSGHAASLTPDLRVVVGAYQWRQLTETTGFSWNQIATVCNTTTGACSGSLGSVSFDGWTWADNAAIRDLFDELIAPGTTQFAGPTSTYSSIDNPDIALAIGSPQPNTPNTVCVLLGDSPLSCGLFAPTSSGFYSATDYLYGWSRSLATSSTAYLPNIVEVRLAGEADAADLGFAGNINAVGDVGFPLGVWLYQPATVVPIPAAFWLLGGALAALGVLRRRT